MTAPEISQGVALLPCPFCGREAEVGNGWPPHDRWICVQCSHCGIKGRDCDTRSEAIAAWNRRAAPRTPVATGESEAIALKIWTDFLDANPSGVTSPEEYPDYALITADELAGLMRDYAERTAALPPSSGLQTADIAFTGPVDGMGDADLSGAYLLLHIARKDGSEERLKVSVGAAEWAAAELVGLVDGPGPTDSSGWEAGAKAMREAAAKVVEGGVLIPQGHTINGIRSESGFAVVDRRSEVVAAAIRALPLPPPSREG